MKALSETAYAFFMGVLAAAIAIGVPTGILMGKNRLLDELLLPWVNIFLSAPLTALVPVLMVLFGFGMKSIIITTTLFAIWIIILNSRAGSDADQPLPGRDGPFVRGDAAGGLHQGLFLGRAAGNTRRESASASSAL